MAHTSLNFVLRDDMSSLADEFHPNSQGCATRWCTADALEAHSYQLRAPENNVASIPHHEAVVDDRPCEHNNAASDIASIGARGTRQKTQGPR